MNDAMLEVLGDYFVKHNLANKGWEFHEFVTEWQRGTIVMARGDLSGAQALDT